MPPSETPTNGQDGYIRYSAKELLIELNTKLDLLQQSLRDSTVSLDRRLTMVEAKTGSNEQLYQEMRTLQQRHGDLRDQVLAHVQLPHHHDTADRLGAIDADISVLKTAHLASADVEHYQERMQVQQRWLLGLVITTTASIAATIVHFLTSGGKLP